MDRYSFLVKDFHLLHRAGFDRRTENHAELLARARHGSKREIEKLVAEIAPRPDVPSRVVALPRRLADEFTAGPQEVVAPVVGPPGQRAPERVAPAAGRPAAVVEPLAPGDTRSA